jgi:fatty acid desaturase
MTTSAQVATTGTLDRNAEGSPADHSVSVQVKQLARLSVSRSVFEIGFTWLQLLAIISICLYFQSLWLTAIGFLLIGAKQYGLLILLHDGTHGLVHPLRRWNDAITLWLIAAPCGSSYSSTRVTHLMHHRYLGDGQRDPDYFLYCAGEPQPKLTAKQFLGHFAKLLIGGQIVYTLFGSHNAGSMLRRSLADKAKSLFPVAVMQTVILGAFTLAGHFMAYFYLWVVPLVTLAVLFNGARVFCDHSVHADASTSAEDILITYTSNPVERFFFAPFHMNFHAEHHLFPYVPHYNLPKLRAILQERPEYRQRIQWRDSYTAYMLDYLSGRDRSESFAKL